RALVAARQTNPSTKARRLARRWRRIRDTRSGSGGIAPRRGALRKEAHQEILDQELAIALPLDRLHGRLEVPENGAGTAREPGGQRPEPGRDVDVDEARLVAGRGAQDQEVPEQGHEDVEVPLDRLSRLDEGLRP